MNERLTSPWFVPFQRMRGIFFRHYYLWARNPEYFFDTFWQPIVEVLIWGFVSLYLSRMAAPLSHILAFFLGAIILWSVLRRGQHEITFSLMEDAWSRNLQNIVMTPVNMVEYFGASILFGVIKLAFELTMMGVLISLLFGFNVLVLGFSLIPFALSLLLTGWAVGLFVNAAIIYFGRGLVALSWIVAFVLQPFSCVFYPLSALPPWAQPIAKAFPGTWIFEGMRQVLSSQPVQLKPILFSFALNGIYLVAGYLVFNKVMKVALDKGLLMKLEW
jgi:ABC-2 type transport system permease protein